MKFLRLTILLIVIFLFQSCLTYRAVTYKINFNERFDHGTVNVDYKDIRSSEKEPKKQEEDFKEAVRLLFEDDFLLDNVEEGIYVKDRKLWEDNGILKASFSGIFKELNVDGNKLDVQNDERILFINESDVDVESNGKVLKSDKNIVLIWPKDQRELTWTMKDIDTAKDTYSLIDYYRSWKKDNSKNQ
jgi:hypothetical protein